MRCFVCYRELNTLERYWKIQKGQKTLIFCRLCCPTLKEVDDYVKSSDQEGY